MNHDDIDRRSLFLHELAMRKIIEQPDLIEKLKTNLTRVEEQASPLAAPIIDFWRGVIATLEAGQLFQIDLDDELHRQALQYTPFAGTLDPEERKAAMDEFHEMIIDEQADNFVRIWNECHGHGGDDDSDPRA